MRKDFIDQNDLERSFQRKLGNTKLQLAKEGSNFFKGESKVFSKRRREENQSNNYLRNSSKESESISEKRTEKEVQAKKSIR